MEREARNYALGVGGVEGGNGARSAELRVGRGRVEGGNGARNYAFGGP